MKQTWQSLLALTGATLLPLSNVANAGIVTADGTDIIIGTKGNVSVKQGNDFEFKLSGRLQWDYTNFNGVFNNDRRGSETELRRGRIKATSKFFKKYELGLQIDIDQDDGQATFNDAFIKYTGWDFADLWVGRFKEPFGLEALTSSKWISTQERSILFNSGAVDQGRPETGIMLSGGGSNYTWALGLFDDGQEDANGEDDYALTGRVTFNPIKDDNQLVHLGLAYSDRNLDNQDFRVRDRLGVRGANRSVLFDARPIDERQQLGLEAAYQRGPFSVQAEYIDVKTDSADAAIEDPEVDGYYVQFNYTITGEKRQYKGGKFDKIKPKGRLGALELVAKYETLEADLDDGLSDPEFEVITVGFNYYIGNVKVVLNYVDADTDNVQGNEDNDDGDAVTARLQYVF